MITAPSCSNCNAMIVVECGYEDPRHGLCYPCASAKLDEIFQHELADDEAHLRPVVGVDGFISAYGIGCVSPKLARAYAADLLRACDLADKLSGS